MISIIKLSDQPIECEAALQAVRSPDAGANLLFLGTTRRWTGDVETTELNYECYEEMARKEIQKLCDEATSRWDIAAICVDHRLGVVPVGEASLAVAVSSSHRLAAFDAAKWLIDTLKDVVPIWKQEVGSDGGRNWVHPDGDGESA